MEEVSSIEYEFQVKEMDVEIQGIEAQIARLQLEKDKYNHQKQLLAKAYIDYIKSQELVEIPDEANVFEEQLEEVKPRKLKK